MGLFDALKKKANQNSDQVEKGIDAAADFAKEKVGEEHADKVDMAADKISDVLGTSDSPSAE